MGVIHRVIKVIKMAQDQPTCSPETAFFANFTLPMLPAPIVFPSAHCPVLGAIIVVLRLLDGPAFELALAPLSAVTPLMGIATVVDASDA